MHATNRETTRTTLPAVRNGLPKILLLGPSVLVAVVGVLVVSGESAKSRLEWFRRTREQIYKTAKRVDFSIHNNFRPNVRGFYPRELRTVGQLR